jgi:hypothetical protein
MQSSKISIFLLIVLIFPVSGTLTWMYFNKLQIKKSVKRAIIHGVPEHQLSLVSISDSNKHLLRWEHSKEFEYLGEMYDIVRRENCGDTTHYWCWWDKEETALNQYIAQLSSGFIEKSADRKQKLGYLFDFFKSIYFVAEEALMVHMATLNKKYNNFHEKDIDTALHSDICPPPPERMYLLFS